jgi:hypothetical protein
MDKFREIHEVRNAKWWLKWQLKEWMVKMVLTNWHWREDKKSVEQTTIEKDPLREKLEQLDK